MKQDRAAELEKITVAIVVIKHRCPMPRDVTYQVTLDPSQFSESREHIRVGNYEGDELRGWIPWADIEVREWLRKMRPERIRNGKKVRSTFEPQAIAA
jgi:hypothetical protein